MQIIVEIVYHCNTPPIVAQFTDNATHTQRQTYSTWITDSSGNSPGSIMVPPKATTITILYTPRSGKNCVNTLTKL